MLIRVGLAIALASPVIYFIAWYLWVHHTLAGIIPTFIQSALDTAGDVITAAINHPIQTAIYIIVTGAISRWVWHAGR